MFRVIVDVDVCENNGRCEVLAPELFALSEDDTEPARVLQDPVSDERLRPAAEAAAQACPKQAIRVD